MRPVAGEHFRGRLAAATLIAVLEPSWAAAATTTTTFTVTTNIVTTCNVIANSLNFGAYTGAAVNGTTTLTATCSNGTPYTLGLDPGTAPSATTTTRGMTGPPPRNERLSYGLFRDTADSENWGDNPEVDTEESTGTGAAQNFTVFGRIPASQFVAPGAYTDTITVILTF